MKYFEQIENHMADDFRKAARRRRKRYLKKYKNRYIRRKMKISNYNSDIEHITAIKGYEY